MRKLSLLLISFFVFLTFKADAQVPERHGKFNPWGWSLYTANDSNDLQALKAWFTWVDSGVDYTKVYLTSKMGQGEYLRLKAAVNSPDITKTVRVRTVQAGEKITNHGINAEGIFSWGEINPGVQIFEYRASSDESWSSVVFKIGENYCINFGVVITPAPNPADCGCKGSDIKPLPKIDLFQAKKTPETQSTQQTQVIYVQTQPQVVYVQTQPAQATKAQKWAAAGAWIGPIVGGLISKDWGGKTTTNTVYIPQGGSNPQPTIYTPTNGGVDGGYGGSPANNGGVDPGYGGNNGGGVDSGFGG